jgi:uroporphyrinogen-III synthase
MATSDLSGLRIVVTRAKHQAGSLARMLRERGAEVEEIPTIEIRPPADFAPLDNALRQLSSYDWLVLTSVNGVEALFSRAEKMRADLSPLKELQICVIGPATRRAIEKRGFDVAVVPRQYVAESVVEALRSEVRGKRVLLVRAKEARDVIPRELRKLAAEVNVVAAYETVVPASARKRLLSLFQSKEPPDAITFTSSSTARHLVAMLGGPAEAREILCDVALISIGPVTSATLREAGLTPAVEASEYTMPGLLAAIIDWAQNRTHEKPL